MAFHRDPLSRARELSLAGLLGALGLLLPIGFHMLGWAGKVFLPMHLPIVVGGFLLSPGTAAGLGLIVPLLSAVLTGMPPLAPPVAPLMSVELAVKAAVIAIVYRSLRGPMWAALAAGLIADWVVLAAAALAFADFLAIEAPPAAYVLGVIVLGWPGTALQIVGVPLAVQAIKRRAPRLAAQREESQLR
jgi:uncharacterized membrane protein